MAQALTFFRWNSPWLLTIAIVCCAFFLPSFSRAQAPPLTFINRSWLVDDGLPHNVVNRAVQDNNGFLWLATGAGLTRFDGLKFSLHELSSTIGKASFNIRDLVLDPSGALLLLPASGGIMRYQNGTFSAHPANAAVAGKSLVDLFAEPDGTIWLGTEDETLIRWHNGESQTFAAAEGLNRRGNRYSFAPDSNGRMWVAGGDFFGWYENHQLHAYAENVGGSVIISPARNGGIWISTFERLLKWENGKLRTILDKPDWPPARSTVRYLFEDRRGGLWLATRRDGLFYFADGKLSRVETSNPLISSVSEDREGNIWVSTEGGGIDRLQPKAFLLLDRTTGLPEDVSTSVCEDAHGAIWCANRNGGLVRYSGEKSESIARALEGAGFFVLSVCPATDDHIWVGAANGLYRASDRAPYGIEKILPELINVRSLFTSRAGDLWISSGEGNLGYLRAGSYHEVMPNAKSSNKRITSIGEDAAGNIWASARDATLLKWDCGNNLVAPVLLPEPSTSRINAIYFDHQDALWVATPRGLLRQQAGKWTVFTQADGLPHDDIDQILEDNDHSLWLGSRIGIFRVKLDDLAARANGKISAVIGTTFGREEGLAGTTPLDGAQPETWKGSDGRLWFATHRGIVGLQPHSLPTGREAPVTFIDEVRIDGQRVASETAVQVPAGNHRVDFRFVALNFSAPEKVRVRHQLVGLDLEPIETSSEHTATYARLPPGRYEMRAFACNQDGIWRAEPTALVITSVAAWWRTPTMVALELTVFTGAVAWLARYWSHRRLKRRLEQLERENALERERARIARDLHDELGGSLTQIRLLAERIKRHSDQPAFKSFAEQLASRARRLSRELESIIWTVSPKNNTWDRLASFIGQYALKFFRDTAIICTVEGAERILPLPVRPDEQHNLLAVTKEALNNVLKHANATRVTVALSQHDGYFSLKIIDDGIGFDPERSGIAACNGLNNMKYRVREIGGEYSITAAPGQGTAIAVSQPMAEKNRRYSAPLEKSTIT